MPGVATERNTPSMLPVLSKPWTSPNAVQLGARGPGDAGPRWARRLGPGLVVGSLHVPLDVLPFDDTRVGSQSAGWVEPSSEHGDGVSPTVVSLRGKNRAPLRSSGERCGERRRS